MARVGRSVRVTGRVQGVFFRGWTADQARELGVTGWVRNCVDGSVESHLAGEEQDVEELIRRIGIGPPDARVDKLVVEDTKGEDFDQFEVRH